MVLDKFRGVPRSDKSEKKIPPRGMIKVFNNTNLKILSNQKSQTNKERVKELTDHELIRLCIENRSSNIYWKEFYERFSGLMDTCIVKTLYSKCGIPFHAITQDIADEISSIIQEKLHGKNILVKALDKENFRGWLRAVVRNATHDWNKARKRQKKAFGYALEAGKKSLYEPIYEDDDPSSCLIDKIAAPTEMRMLDDVFQRVHPRVNVILQAIERLPGLERLVLKAKLIFYNSLDDEDIREIASMRAVAPSVVNKEVNALLNSLVKKNEQYEHDRNLIIIKFVYLERLNYKLSQMEKNPNTSPGELKELQGEIEEKKAQLENLRLKVPKNNVYPEAKEIAKLLGLPKSKQKNIGVWLNRARIRLKAEECNIFKE